MSQSRDTLNALLPKGAAWEVKQDGDFDNYLEGKAESIQTIYEYLLSLSELRDPQKTTLLSDLEKEFGLSGGAALTESERRDLLSAKKYERDRSGGADDLQDALHRAGFTDLYVYRNDPIVDPASLLLSPELFIVNEFRFNDRYSLPTNPLFFQFVFFIGGAVTYGGGGEITSLAPVQIPINKFNEYYDIVLSYKPMHTWAATNVIPVGCPLQDGTLTDINDGQGEQILTGTNCTPTFNLVLNAGADNMVTNDGDQIVVS